MTTNGGSPVTRTANKQNEITSVSGATTPTYDANGNMTGDETGKTFVYDAWNRLVAVKSGATTLKGYGYDGLNRRVTETASGTTTDLYYTAAWQVAEEKAGSNTTKRYVWSPVYVDAMILRDRDTNADGTLDERLWVTQDANFNVTALVDGSGAVVERFVYDPFGVRTVYDASWSVRSGGSSYDFQHGFQGFRFDATANLNSAHRRWYSPALGVWASIDPILYAGGDNRLYGFVGNKPTGRLDPSGLLGCDTDRRSLSFSIPFDSGRSSQGSATEVPGPTPGSLPTTGDRLQTQILFSAQPQPPQNASGFQLAPFVLAQFTLAPVELLQMQLIQMQLAQFTLYSFELAKFELLQFTLEKFELVPVVLAPFQLAPVQLVPPEKPPVIYPPSVYTGGDQPVQILPPGGVILPVDRP